MPHLSSGSLRPQQGTMENNTLTCNPATFSQVFGRQGQLMQAAVQSLNTLNDQIAHFMVNRPKALDDDDDTFLPSEKETLKKSMTLMRQLLMDAQAKILKMMDDNKQLALRIDGAIQSASQEVTNLRSELTATSRRLAEISASEPSTIMENNQHNTQDPSIHQRQKAVTDICLKTDITSLMDFSTPDSSLDKVMLREEVVQLQEEIQLLRQMKEMLTKDLEESQGGKSAEVLSATELKVQLAQKEQELARAKEALQAMKADRKRLKAEKADLVNQMQQLYATLESREEQLRDFIRNYEQHRKESEDAVKALAKEKDLLEREKWDLRRQAKEATEHASTLRTQLDLKENRIKELEAELAMAKQSLATLTKDVPKRHSLAMPTETLLNGNQEWVMQADLPLTAAIRQSQQSLYHGHQPHPAADRPAVRVSPCHSRQPSSISDASAIEGDRSSTPSDINSPRHRTHSLCNSLEDLEDQKRKKKKEKMGLGSLSRVFARGKQRKSMDPGLFDDSDSLSSPTNLSLTLSNGEVQMDRLQQVELARTTPMSHWKAGTVQAWLEVIMAMPMYIKACTDNIKSGKVLLGLTDEDLELGLGVTSSMHRRKLRLAIEDYREAETGKGLSKAADMDHHWVAKAWLSDIGLPQYSQAFQNHLVDGRMLSSLSRRDLEKYLSVSKKTHQVSVMLAIELLHLLSFNKEVLQERRLHCENQNTDPIVWTNQRVMKWIRDIDLKEYVDSLQNSGVHGAVLVLEPAFHTEVMANTLGIPSSKHIVRRHLMEEMRALISSARVGLQQGYERSTPSVILQGSLGRLSSSMCRQSADKHSLKGRAGKPPLSKAFSGKELDGRYNSFPRKGRGEGRPHKPEGSPKHSFRETEVTNV
ncbi:kazrin-like isoform X2 [Polyodon spathula]|uniref:kazrin-like isoform X2 n=1 Tax=Polyodon spathula TaxID=7913 RepID=UPI001B7D93AF|nr:kazrin-like isoform X2 [Polyodon spathula]